jgi:hypothetical protein
MTMLQLSLMQINQRGTDNTMAKRKKTKKTNNDLQNTTQKTKAFREG